MSDYINGPENVHSTNYYCSMLEIFISSMMLMHKPEKAFSSHDEGAECYSNSTTPILLAYINVLPFALSLDYWCLDNVIGPFHSSEYRSLCTALADRFVD